MADSADPAKTMRRRLAVSVLFATALSVVFASRVFVAFEGVRVKLVRESTPAISGRLVIDAGRDGRIAGLRPPVALIAIIANQAQVSQRFTVSVNGDTSCAIEVPAGATRRVDCADTNGWSRGAAPVIEISAAHHPWALDFLEVATHHGASTRLLPFHIVPETSTIPRMPGVFTCLLVWGLLSALFAVPPPVRWPRNAERVSRALAALSAGWLAIVIAAPLVSPYLIAMPVRSFVIVAGMLLVPQLARVAEELRRAVTRGVRSAWTGRPGVRVTVVALVVLLPYALVVRQSAQQFSGNYSGLLRIAERNFDRSPLLSGRDDVRASLALLPDDGYDGQFAYFAAFDPFLRRFRDQPQHYRAVVDAPPYRFGRIGFTWLTRGLSGDRWQRYPAVMLGLVLFGIAVTAGATAWLAQTAGRSVWWGLLILAVPGFWQSVRVVLPEPLAAATLLVGYGCLVRRRLAVAVVLFAISLLIRETGLVLVAMLVLWPGPQWSWRERGWLMAAMAPLVLWRLYVAGVLWPDWGWEGLLYSAGNVGLPLQGIVDLWSALAGGDYFPSVGALTRAAVWYPVVLIVVGAGGWLLRHTLDRRVAWALGVYVVLALSLTHPIIWGHVANAQRGSYEMFVLLFAGAAAAPTLSLRDRRVVLVCAMLCAAFILFGAHDALDTRAALFP